MSRLVVPRLNRAEREMMERLVSADTLDNRQATRVRVVLGRADWQRTTEFARVRGVSGHRNPPLVGSLDDGHRFLSVEGR